MLDAAPFDLSKLRLTAAPQPVLDAMGSFVSNGDAMYSVVDNGTLAYIPTEAVAPNEELVWVDRTGKLTPVLARKAAYEAPNSDRMAASPCSFATRASSISGCTIPLVRPSHR